MDKGKAEASYIARLAEEARLAALDRAENERLRSQEQARGSQALIPQIEVAIERACELLTASGWKGAKKLHRRDQDTLFAALFGYNEIIAVPIGYIYNDGETNDPVAGWLGADGVIYAHDQWTKYIPKPLSYQPVWMLENILGGITYRINVLDRDDSP